MRICLLLVLTLTFLPSCAKRDPVREQSQRNLEEEIILLKLRLQETENRLSERIRVLEMERMQQLLSEEGSDQANQAASSAETKANYSGPEYTALEDPATASDSSAAESEPSETMAEATPVEPAASSTTTAANSGKPGSGQGTTSPAATTQAYGDALYGVEDGASSRSYEAAPATSTTQDNRDLPIVAADQVRETYNRASDELKNRRYQKAGDLFQAIATQHPNHRLAPNALYWLGESAYGQREYQQAVDQFQRVLDRYPESNKAPDALLKLGKSYERLGDVASAKESYRLVISRFPNSRAAQIAQTWL